MTQDIYSLQKNTYYFFGKIEVMDNIINKTKKTR